jgi:hypothetical protein
MGHPPRLLVYRRGERREVVARGPDASEPMGRAIRRLQTGGRRPGRAGQRRSLPVCSVREVPRPAGENESLRRTAGARDALAAQVAVRTVRERKGLGCCESANRVLQTWTGSKRVQTENDAPGARDCWSFWLLSTRIFEINNQGAAGSRYCLRQILQKRSEATTPNSTEGCPAWQPSNLKRRSPKRGLRIHRLFKVCAIAHVSHGGPVEIRCITERSDALLQPEWCVLPRTLR